ncbi:MAG: apolipoprotein N-acyltransferase [Pseudomonadota bacterium]|nr:apolipoprotein N-acyltransferase [Pseudomonadota bacterium]
MPSLNIPLPVRALAAAVGGALTALAFAPFSFFLLAPVALALFYELLTRRPLRGGFWVGWGFGIGLLGFGVFWIRISLNEFGNMAPWLAHSLTIVFVLAMALYYGVAGWLVTRLAAGPRWSGPLLAFPAALVLVEWLRGWLFTGFPWLAIGYSQVDSPLGGYAPLIGVYGVSLLVAVSGGLLWGLVRWPGKARYAVLGGLAVLWLAGPLLMRVDWTYPQGDAFRATVVQANIPQSLKWDPDSRIPSLRAYVELTRESWGSDVIVWPETAVPDFLNRVRDVLIDPLAEEAREEEAELVIGIPVLEVEERAYYNGLISIGGVEDLYTKRHLVPFGEFIPFKGWLGALAEAFEVPMSDFSAGRAERPLLRVGDHLVGASICYEDAFPAEVIQALPDAAYLINVSNDAWFGDSLAPHQHLEIARMRALENERWLLRSTNTGISAILDHKGRVLGRVPAFERGLFTAEVQPRAGATPFARIGNWLAIGAALLMLAAAFLLGRRRGV